MFNDTHYRIGPTIYSVACGFYYKDVDYARSKTYVTCPKCKKTLYFKEEAQA